jgi:hypothetical protein
MTSATFVWFAPRQIAQMFSERMEISYINSR